MKRIEIIWLNLIILNFYYFFLNKENADAPVFIEHHLLSKRHDTLVWRQSGRWIKYEQGIEGLRWSRPHVASMDMAALAQLHDIFKSQTILLLDYELHGQHMTFQNRIDS